MFRDDFLTICRQHHLRRSTEKSYWFHARKHILWRRCKAAKCLAENPTEKFREYIGGLAEEDSDHCFSSSYQDQAFHAIRFLYEQVVGVKLGDLSNIPRCQKQQKIVDVPDDETANKIVNSIPGINGLALRLIRGTAMRLNDCLRLRVKDFNFSKRLITIQDSKGGKSRVVPMPKNLVDELEQHAIEREKVHQQDLVEGFGWVHTPGHLAEKYKGIEKDFVWQYFFASTVKSKDPITGNIGRHHIIDTVLQRAFADARRRLKIKRRYTIHGLRHATAQWLERQGIPRSKIQELLGHKDGATTDHYLLSGIRTVSSIPSPI